MGTNTVFSTLWLFLEHARNPPRTGQGMGTQGDTRLARPHGRTPWEPPKPRGDGPTPAAGAMPAPPGPVTTPQEGAEVGLFLVGSSAELLPGTGLPEQLGHTCQPHRGHFCERDKVLESPGRLAPRWCESAWSAPAACCRGTEGGGERTRLFGQNPLPGGAGGRPGSGGTRDTAPGRAGEGERPGRKLAAPDLGTMWPRGAEVPGAARRRRARPRLPGEVGSGCAWGGGGAACVGVSVHGCA